MSVGAALGTFDDEVVRFFSDPEERADPQGFWRRLREVGGPVYHSEGTNEWYISGFNESYSIMVNEAKNVSYSPRSAPDFDDSNVGSFRQTMYDTLLFLMDPPKHQPTRDVPRKTFSGASAELWRPAIHAWVAESLDMVEPGASFDFVSEIGRVFPGRLTCALFGLPVEDYETIQHYANGYLGLLEPNITPEREEAANRAGRAFTDYLAPFVERRLAGDRQNDLLDELLDAERAGLITRHGVTAFVLNLLVGGHQTIAGTLANGLVAFHENPDQWKKLVDDPSLRVGAVEEILRYANPLNLMPAHFMRCDVELGGVLIPESAATRVVLSGANRDPRNFPDPEKFDITRTEQRHLGMGFGPHFCLGASFARTELQEFFGALAEKKVTMSFDPDEVEWARGLVDWAPSYLPVKVGQA